MSAQTVSRNAVPTSPIPIDEIDLKRHPKGVMRWVVLVVLGILGLIIVAPILLLVMDAFKSNADYSANGPLSWPEGFSLEGFKAYMEVVNYPRALLNSIVISALVAAFGVVLSLMSAYAIGIGRIKGGTAMLTILLLATMVPQEALIYPLFYGAQATHTINTVWSVIIVFTILQAAYGTYLLSSVMSTLPMSLLEAAALDGAGRWRTLWSVIFPLVRGTMSVLMVFFFIWTWNEFYIPLVLLSGQDSQTVPIAIATLQGQNAVNVTAMNAGSLLSLLPTLVFFLIFQRTLTKGVTLGAVK
ncbi:carbohydrate ABC transporter permease [Acidipropionibacterium virtanenii]|uniref:L-arabinose transport system permease protein AraQ n=1 Tax=Acidipropionibacterium virtanenii TaxID=2057246 RepID=A0A344UQJ6_9ACTN|nr:carbohydrate ABC transporter permease [Acidipropionibacterium virtanenii]AXE37544.1 L-arabinose transport system permease protein AraQ [Acidipropionibacterium virtanenii]